jgi:hypothetical protein
LLSATQQEHACLATPFYNGASQNKKDIIMDAEQINAIGYQLADLTQRAAALRGYL